MNSLTDAELDLLTDGPNPKSGDRIEDKIHFGHVDDVPPPDMGGSYEGDFIVLQVGDRYVEFLGQDPEDKIVVLKPHELQNIVSWLTAYADS